MSDDALFRDKLKHMGKCESGSGTGGGRPPRGCRGWQGAELAHAARPWVPPHVSAGTRAPGLLATPCGRLAQVSPPPPDSHGWHVGVQGTGHRTLQAHAALRRSSAPAAALWSEVSNCVSQFWARASHTRQRQGAAVPCAMREAGSFSPGSALQSWRRKQRGCCNSPFPNPFLLATQSASPVAEQPKFFGQPDSDHR